MRIGIDCRLPAYQMGGISRYMLQLLPALAALDGENSYTVWHSRKDKASHLPPGAPNFRRAVAWTPPHHRLEKWSLSLELLPRRLHLWHSPDFIPPLAGARRFVITVHDLTFLIYPQFLTHASRRYYRGQIAWAVAHAAHLLADSEHTRQDLLQRLDVPPQKVTTVPLAASSLYQRAVPPAEVAATLQRYQLPAGFLLFVGTLEPRKNVPALLQAYALLRQEHGLDPPLLLVGGKGWFYQEVFETVDRLGLARYVRHLPAVPDEDLAALYAAAGLLALPSHYEGFGLPALEAMHQGCPVLASNRASLPELVGHAGILLNPDDVAGWAENMARVLSDSQRRAQMSRLGRQQAAQFSWERTAAATLAVYRQVLAN